MLDVGHPHAMNTATLSTHSHNGSGTLSARTGESAAAQSLPVPQEVIDNLVVRIPARDESKAIAELALRAGASKPAGALMVGALGDRLLAVVSMSDGKVLNEPTPAGEAAAAVVRYTLARRRRQRRAA
jgi:hypothetical protein